MPPHISSVLEREKSDDLSGEVEKYIRDVSLINILQSKDDEIRHISLADWCKNIPLETLLEEAREIHLFVQQSKNLYERVRALFFLYSIHRFQLIDLPSTGTIPHEGYKCLLDRDFIGAIDIFLKYHEESPNRAISSALAKAYYQLGFQTLADQVRSSVREHPGNAWLFQVVDPKQYPKRIHPDLLTSSSSTKILCEKTPVRMDLSHSGWSDIFFLGMDYPEGARVLNVSVDLAVHGKHDSTSPPIESYLELLDTPVLKLTSIDLKCSVSLTHISEVFDFCRDYLGLLRAGIIASGIVPPGLEHSTETLATLFETMIGPGKGLHLTTKVNDIPKGSRLAVSTNLLGSIISLCMRATQQTTTLTGDLREEERRMVAARAILGEWLGGSGGGWQDSGGVWPGIKLIQGVKPSDCDPEYGVSRGCLLPLHRQLSNDEASPELVDILHNSLVLVHGGMAQNVGPVLEMVTEKYLLRESTEWIARQEALSIFDDILRSLKNEDVETLAQLTTKNFFEPIQSIIPWASNLYTETLIERTQKYFGDDFLGFWMLGGCSGGGMGFIFKPEAKLRALDVMQNILLTTKREMEHTLPFAMDPVVFDYSINHRGTVADFCAHVPTLFKGCSEVKGQPDEQGADTCCTSPMDLGSLLESLGFNQESHASIQQKYKDGTIGLKQNRLSSDIDIQNVQPGDVIQSSEVLSSKLIARGNQELSKGTIGVVSLAAGIGSRWTEGGGCVKGIHPFCKLKGRHRSFLEVHLAKSRRMSSMAGKAIPHVFTTSHLTNTPIESYLERCSNFSYKGDVYISKGKSIGLRLVPTLCDLRFAYEEKQQQKLDVQAQKVRASGQNALMGWAKSCGEATDYTDNLPFQCLHPVGHYFEVPNLILSGTLKKMIDDRPQLKYLMLHNIDTVGADVHPGLLGMFADSDATLIFEVIPREIEDVGGGLARVNGRPQLMEGLALPREEDEFKCTYYNTMTTWIHIDRLLEKFGLSRNFLDDNERVVRELNAFAERLPTYVALKDVKKRWGEGQEDVLPTAQFEKLWSDMSTLEDMDCKFVVVPRCRGAQLKEQCQLDGWVRDGSSTYLETICEF